MSDAENPYRFVEAVEQEESADAPRTASAETYEGWDLRGYVAPESEPVYSPAEIAELGKGWWGVTLVTMIDHVILGVFTLLLLLPQPGSPPADLFLMSFLALGALAIQTVVAREAYVVCRALRYPRRIAALTAAAYALPVTSLLLLLSLATEAIVTLRRHGIPAGLWLARSASLPRRIDERKRSDS